jgi:tungstate transport system substrate-binding protein
LNLFIVAVLAAASPLLCTRTFAHDDKSIVVASSTEPYETGLFDFLLPIFRQKTGIEVTVLVRGTGQALDIARYGYADVVFVHAKSAEEKFLTQGWGVRRCPVMYDDFVLIGPKNDPAETKGKDILTALQAIKTKAAPFISRADRSGTNIAELALWKDAGIDIATDHGPWYREIGDGLTSAHGMNAALNMAVTYEAYVLSDRGTWLAFQNHGDLATMVEGDDKRLFNQYSVILVNPVKIPDVRTDLGQQFIDWLISPEGQNLIASYKVNGQQLFYPDADDLSH